jgi:hypothetical protein
MNELSLLRPAKPYGGKRTLVRSLSHDLLSSILPLEIAYIISTRSS